MARRNSHVRIEACLLARLAIGAILPASAIAQPPTYVDQWGSKGSGPGQFNLPSGIVVDGASQVYVADYLNGRVQKLTTTGTYLTEWAVAGGYPNGLALDGRGNIYVTCDGDNTVKEFTVDGDFLTQWGGFGYPAGIAIGDSGNVYVADFYGGQIYKFTMTGSLITQWTASGSYGLAVDAPGHLFATDWPTSSVSEFAGDGSFIARWGGNGGADGQLSHPTGLTVSPLGDVVVADYFNQRIQEYTADGIYVTKWGNGGTGDGQFSYPHSVAVDNDKNVYVTDQYNGRIQKFGPVDLDVEPTVGAPALQFTPITPNPSSGRTTMAFVLPKDAAAFLSIHDVGGGLVAQWAWARLSAGRHAVEWDGRGLDGRPARAGVYFSRLSASGRLLSQRFIRLR